MTEKEEKNNHVQADDVEKQKIKNAKLLSLQKIQKVVSNRIFLKNQ